MVNTVVGMFPSWDEARVAVNRLRDAGFSPEDVSILARAPDRAETAGADDDVPEEGEREEEGTVVGAATGGALGAAGGWALGLAALAIPGVGPFIAAGPIMGALAGMAAGAGVGGVIGSIMGHGDADEDAKKYEAALHGGGVMVAVAGAGREAEARAILVGTGAENVHREALDESELSGSSTSPASQEHTDASLTAAGYAPAVAASSAEELTALSALGAAPSAQYPSGLAGDDAGFVAPGAASATGDADPQVYHSVPQVTPAPVTADTGEGTLTGAEEPETEPAATPPHRPAGPV
ncbi:MAG TPA: hypothetical protein VK689_00335 [Armatimonadota bacterium]|nr:hypothetical protein [Armatimonadota bacterium]